MRERQSVCLSGQTPSTLWGYVICTHLFSVVRFSLDSLKRILWDEHPEVKPHKCVVATDYKLPKNVHPVGMYVRQSATFLEIVSYPTLFDPKFKV